MVQFSSMFNGLAKSRSIGNGKTSNVVDHKEIAYALMVEEARKNGLLLTSPGKVNACWSDNYASAYSKKGNKGVNQDRFAVWEGFGCRGDVLFCGIFDGHGSWGHLVAKRVRKLMPAYLFFNWQSENCNLFSSSKSSDDNLVKFDFWKKTLHKSCFSVDQDLEKYEGIDSFHSGSTALTIIRQGDLIVLANVGDSRAVLATTGEDGSLVPVQLTVDQKPNLPHETDRIKQRKGKVCSSSDEPGVYRIRMADGEIPIGPGLALSRAFGDYFIKDFGLISEPEVTQRTITDKDRFIILATDGVWDVISNDEAIQIVASAPDREKSAKRLVEHAARSWRLKRKGLEMDDISTICLFFHTQGQS